MQYNEINRAVEAEEYTVDDNDIEDEKDWPWYYWLLLPFAKLAQKLFKN